MEIEDFWGGLLAFAVALAQVVIDLNTHWILLGAGHVRLSLCTG